MGKCLMYVLFKSAICLLPLAHKLHEGRDFFQGNYKFSKFSQTAWQLIGIGQKTIDHSRNGISAQWFWYRLEELDKAYEWDQTSVLK